MYLKFYIDLADNNNFGVEIKDRDKGTFLDQTKVLKKSCSTLIT